MDVVVNVTVTNPPLMVVISVTGQVVVYVEVTYHELAWRIWPKIIHGASI